ncbi:unnamed protein product, partial [Urochloa humidicola]
ITTPTPLALRGNLLHILYVYTITITYPPRFSFENTNPNLKKGKVKQTCLEQLLADGDYELVPTGGEEPAEGEVNAVQVVQEPEPVPEDQPTNPEPEG